jgi:ATP-binding cassette subfamily B multidrug efflux pump
MRHLAALNSYFWKYRVRLLLGFLFIILSNYFGILAPQLTGYIVDQVQHFINPASFSTEKVYFDPLVQWFIARFEKANIQFGSLVMYCGMLLLAFALLRGFFMFLMRQTIIVMSRHIEYDQKNEVYAHYQTLDTQFYKTHSTGDLMSRMSEDISRVRMYTGPAIMYLINLTILIGISLFYMFKKDPLLSLYVLSPLPLLVIAMYYVNSFINRKSERIQEQLSGLTSVAQESYSGIRVLKSFSMESASVGFFEKQAESYRKSGLSLSTAEAIYFPAIGLLIGLSTLLTVYIGSIYQLEHRISAGTITEFVVYINMLTFPVSAIGWVASNIQRAAASQKRLNDFLQVKSTMKQPLQPQIINSINEVVFSGVDFTYPHTGIHAINNLDLQIKRGEKVAIIGKTGSGKSTIALLLLRMYDTDKGMITLNGHNIKDLDIASLRRQISYVPQEVFLFSDTVVNNINFGSRNEESNSAELSAERASINEEIKMLPDGFDTMVGERGVTLSGGQKQRISIARALSKEADLLVFDDCLSAVDAKTEHRIASSLNQFLENRTALIITHRIFPSFKFDQIVVMENGTIFEKGTHEELMNLKGYYYDLLRLQEGVH